MKFVVRVIKKSQPHYYSRRLVYMSFANGSRSEVPKEKHGRFIEAVGFWDSLFKIKYGDFRDGVEEICEEYNSKCKFDATLKHTEAMELLGAFDGFVFTTDEDNLIDHPLVGLLRRHPVIELVKWHNFRVGHKHVAGVWDDSRPLVLPTGGYAVPANDGIDKYVELLHCHGATSKYMNSFKLLNNEPLGLVMVHPSSHGVLSKMLTVGNVKNSVKQFLINKQDISIKPRYVETYSKIIKLYESL